MFKVMLITSALLLMALTGCQSDDCGTQTNDKQQLTIGVMSAINSIPYIVAQQQGLLPENIAIEFFRDHMERDAALTAGQIDGVMTDLMSFFLFAEGGEDMVGVAATQGRFGIAVNNDAIVTARDLEGKVVASITNSVVEVVLDALVREAGGDPSLVSLEIVPPPPLRLELLRAGQVDAAVLPEPLLTTVTNETDGRVLAYSEAPLTLIMVTRDAYHNKRAELATLFEAVDNAITFMNRTNRDEYLPNAVTELGLGDDIFAVNLPEFLYYSLPDEDVFMHVQEWMRELGRIEGYFSYSDLIRSVK